MNDVVKKQNVKNVTAWRIRAKQRLVDICGNKCNCCGYNRCINALEFHHIDETKKDFGISELGHTRSFKLVVEEIKKCVMVCSNCHREIHNGLLDVMNIKVVFDEELANKYCISIATTREKRKKYDTCGCGEQKPTNRLFCSKQCSGRARRKLVITDDELMKLYSELQTIAAVANALELSSTVVRKRIKTIKLIQEKMYE